MVEGNALGHPVILRILTLVKAKLVFFSQIRYYRPKKRPLVTTLVLLSQGTLEDYTL